jgi:preprotein translocase subunit SecA
MEYLREGIGLRGYAQVDPLVAYKREAGQVFEETLHSIRDEVLSWLFHFQVAPPPPRQMIRINQADGNPVVPSGSVVPRSGAVQRMPANAPLQTSAAGVAGTAQAVGVTGKIGRNDPCPCGSGKKYKKCCYPNYG